MTPTVLIDIGATLISRTTPGPFVRCVQALEKRGIDTDDQTIRTMLARCVLTGLDRDAAARRAVEDLALCAQTASTVREALLKPEGEPQILPGAHSLLWQAGQRGWNVVAVTNAARWTPGLPTTLGRLVAATVSSSDVGVLKQDPEFWRRITNVGGDIDARSALVIGDDPRADGATPSEVGFCSIIHGGEGPSLNEIAEWIARAPEPPSDPLGVAAARSFWWAGHNVVAAPHLVGLVKSVTRRRVRASFGNNPAITTSVVRRRNLPPALIVPESLHGGLVWLSAVGDRRHSTIPPDLMSALTEHQISVDGLADRELQQLTAMVREATDADVRRSRINGVVDYLLRSGNGSP